MKDSDETNNFKQNFEQWQQGIILNKQPQPKTEKELAEIQARASGIDPVASNTGKPTQSSVVSHDMCPSCGKKCTLFLSYFCQCGWEQTGNNHEAWLKQIASLESSLEGKKTAELRAEELSKQVLAWWEEHQYDEIGDSENPANMYDTEPEFVKQAQRIIEERKGKGEAG